MLSKSGRHSPHAVVSSPTSSVFDRFGISPVVNCCGIYTDLGGSVLSEKVWEACSQLNTAYVPMVDLLQVSGKRLAAAVGAEAARVTPGASAAIVLAVAATMTGCDGNAWQQLPLTTGLKSDVLTPAAHLPSYKYAGCARLTGAALIPAGPSGHYSEAALLEAVGSQTACILVAAHLLDGFDGVEQLASLTAGAHDLGVPVVVDAAYMCFPVELMRSYAAAGADLTCFSAKYFGGPNSGGFVAGRERLIKAVAGLDFTGFESGPFRAFGRPFKMSRYDIAATALAFDEWIASDHDQRLAEYRRKAEHIQRHIDPLPAGINAVTRFFTMAEEFLDQPDRVNAVVLEFTCRAERSARDVARELEQGSPTIAAVVDDSRLIIAVDALLDGQEKLVASRLLTALNDRLKARQSTAQADRGLR